MVSFKKRFMGQTPPEWEREQVGTLKVLPIQAFCKKKHPLGDNRITVGNPAVTWLSTASADCHVEEESVCSVRD